MSGRSRSKCPCVHALQGLPLGSGMGSSAASAAAACWAVNNLFGNPIPKEELVLAGLQSEAFVSGYHADNIAPALLGGFILVRCAAATSHSAAPPRSAATCRSAAGWLDTEELTCASGSPANDTALVFGATNSVIRTLCIAGPCTTEAITRSSTLPQLSSQQLTARPLAVSGCECVACNCGASHGART